MDPTVDLREPEPEQAANAMRRQPALLDPSIDGVLSHPKVRRNHLDANPWLVGVHRAPREAYQRSPTRIERSVLQSVWAGQ
jgi:hypothetical protein